MNTIDVNAHINLIVSAVITEIPCSKNDGSCSVFGDYLLPASTLPEHETVFIGRYGRLHKEYLKMYKNDAYTELLLSGKLIAYLDEIDTHASDMVEILMKQMTEI